MPCDRDKIKHSASEVIRGSVCLLNPVGRDNQMNKLTARTGLTLAKAIAIAVGNLLISCTAFADDRPKGPEEDGTKPALTRIAGEGIRAIAA